MISVAVFTTACASITAGRGNEDAEDSKATDPGSLSCSGNGDEE